MFRSFFIKLILFTIVLAVVIAVLNFLSPFFQSFQSFTWMSLVFFFLLTLLAGFMALRSLEKSPHGFIASVNGIVVLKLFLSIALIILYLVIAKPGSPKFITSFFALYILFTAFEIREFIIVQKKKLKEKIPGNGSH